MKKILLLSLICFTTLAMVPQGLEAQEKSKEYLIESSNLKELKKYKWKDVHKYFKSFNKKDEVVLRVKYENPAAEPEKKGQVDNFDISVSGEARNIKDLTTKMENLIEILSSRF
ncbi:hypothetical protein [Winogradskyella aurantiaca]|uniref:hypothetical protein n=1 Tax=Winogradskyella aurantiaca TaxID=2219558 RepID=UPI0013006B3C|nr:hypothetical protein [Winogradskyella aurantiaca]